VRPTVRSGPRGAGHRGRREHGRDGHHRAVIELAGGPDAKFVIVPTAQGNRRRDGTLRTYREEEVIESWQRRGLKNVRMLHTADPGVADSADFVEPLVEANAVWFEGGRQWNIVDSYMGTRTLSAFRQVLERGGVIGGSSAGATIQGDYLVRGDTSGPDVMMTEEKNHQRGFALLRKSAIDQHVDTRNRWDDLVPVVAKYPDLLGLGLSEGTAIVVTGDRFEVMGRGKVAVHDSKRPHPPGGKAYHLLAPGDVYDMKTRSLTKP
jgi:cyanophycinase